MDRDCAVLAALSPIREMDSPAGSGDDGVLRPKVQVNDSTVVPEGVIRVERPKESIEMDHVTPPVSPRKGTAKAEGTESPKTPWRKRWNRIVRQNRATKLRINASPAVKHNHETGSLYHLEGEQAERIRRDRQGSSIAKGTAKNFGNLFGALKKKEKKKDVRRSASGKVLSTKRRKSGAPRVVRGEK